MSLLRRNVVRVLPLVALVLSALATPVACSSSAAPSAAPDGGSNAAESGPVARFVLGAGSSAPNFLDVPFPSDAYLSNGTMLPTIPGLQNSVPTDTSYINAGLARLNGFSRLALSVFAVDTFGGDAGSASAFADGGTPVSAIIDPTSLPVAETDCIANTSSVYVVDLAAGAATPLLPCRAAFHDDQPRSQTTPVIAVGPPRGYLLQEAHQYAAVLTSRVKDTSGRHLAASTDFAAVVAGTAPGEIGAIYVAAFAAASAALKTALATDGATIVSIAPFTTMKKTGELLALRDALENVPPPTLSWDADAMAPMGTARFAAVNVAVSGDSGVPSGDSGAPSGDSGAPSGDGGAADDGGTSDAAAPDSGSPGSPGTPSTLPPGFTASLDDWLGVATAKLPDGTDDPDQSLPVEAHDTIAAVGSAVFQATSYLQVKPLGYTDPAHATFQYDDTGTPVAQSDVPIWITFATPKAAMPPAGYPTVIMQHGLSASREFIMTMANRFTSQGWLVVAIDSVTFGARASEAMYRVDVANNFGTGSGAKYKGPDGLADDPTNGSTDMFGGLENIVAIGDQFRQAGFDTAQVVRLLRSGPDLSPLNVGSGVPKIDATKIAYIGDSLGAMEGTIAAAIEPPSYVAAWYLNVNAGSIFPDLASHSPVIGPLLGEAAGINFGIAGDTYTWSHPFLQVLQDIIEPGDPISYAPYLTLSPQPLVGQPTTARNAIQTEVIWDYFVTDEANEAIARAAGWGLATPNVGSNADIVDPTNTIPNLRATPFVQVNPDGAGAIHDTPATGTTAVLIQVGPAQHGVDLVSSQGDIDFAVPFAPPYTKLDAPVPFTQDYRGLQTVALTFFADAFAGKVPRVLGPTADAGVLGAGFGVPVRIVVDAGSN